MIRPSRVAAGGDDGAGTSYKDAVSNGTPTHPDTTRVSKRPPGRLLPVAKKFLAGAACVAIHQVQDWIVGHFV